SLIVDELLPEVGRYGFFVAVPARGVGVGQPVTPDALVHVHALKRFAPDKYADKPYPISAEVYWGRKSEWFGFPVAVSNDSITVTPPQTFCEEVLAHLSPPEDNGGDAP